MVYFARFNSKEKKSFKFYHKIYLREMNLEKLIDDSCETKNIEYYLQTVNLVRQG